MPAETTDDRRKDWGPWGYIPESGITRRHFRIFQACAYHLEYVIAVRNTNEKSAPWIDENYPPKPKKLEQLHTHADTGRVTAKGDGEIQLALRLGFFVVDDKGLARDRAGARQEVRLSQKLNEVLRPGEVIDPEQKRVIVGDYDLLAVFPLESPGSNLALVASNSHLLKNFLGPYVKKVQEWVNTKLVSDGEMPRILHGADDQYMTKPVKAFSKGGAVAFYPDGMCDRLLNSPEDVQKFYGEFSRQPGWGKYGNSTSARASGGQVVNMLKYRLKKKWG